MNSDNFLAVLGENLRAARKKYYPKDDLKSFSLRIGVSRATLQRMEKGDLSVAMGRYYQAAKLLDLELPFNELLKPPVSLFDD